VEQDLLGAPYERQTIDLGRDDEGPVVATLVRRRATRRTGRAVLYVHGFVDYFFQTHLADFFADRGWDFYALDLRKYGRSLLPHQTPNFCRDLSDYFPELDAAAEIIRADGNRTLLVNGHSTGGLIAALWAHEHRADGIVDGLFLNSPFFDINAPWLVRRPLTAAVSRLSRRAPYRIIPRTFAGVYGESLHAEHRGEWQYDLAWKPLVGFPVRLGWLAAIRTAQRRLRAGLEIPVPVLIACSTRSLRSSTWHDSAHLADTVLDVAHIVRWAPRLGRHVTVVRFDGGMHDLTLSGPAVREQVFSEVGRWTDAFVAPVPPTPPAGATPTSGPEDPTRSVPAVGTGVPGTVAPGTGVPTAPARPAAAPARPAAAGALPTPAGAALLTPAAGGGTPTPGGTALPTSPGPATRTPDAANPTPAGTALPRPAGPANPTPAGTADPRPAGPANPTPAGTADPTPAGPAASAPPAAPAGPGAVPGQAPARPDGTAATTPAARPGDPG
jgi:alpha-beta hydrolase superfamily lysophospholipase